MIVTTHIYKLSVLLVHVWLYTKLITLKKIEVNVKSNQITCGRENYLPDLSNSKL